MALIECYECKGKVSSKAKACPHCGLPIEVGNDTVKKVKRSKKGIILKCFIALIVILFGWRVWYYGEQERRSAEAWRIGQENQESIRQGEALGRSVGGGVSEED